MLAESQTDERSCPRVLAMEIWRECCWLPSSSPSAVSTTRPAPRCPRRRPITRYSPVLLPDWTSRILTPFQGLLHFFQQQREQTLVTCYRDFLGHSQSESVNFLALPSYYFWLLENSVLFVFARQLALNTKRIPWAYHLPP